MTIFRTASRLAALALGAALALSVALQSGVARAEIKKQFIDYKQGDTQLSGLLVYDDALSGKRPGVLLAHDRAGMADNAFRDSELIAKLGYVVFVADMFGKGFVPKDVPEMTATITIYNNDRPLMRARAAAGFAVLKSNPMVDTARIAVVGYCFGGTVAVELTETGIPIVGMISVHGSFRNFSPEAAKSIKGRVLILHGAEDPVVIPKQAVLMYEALKANSGDVRFWEYASVHHNAWDKAYADPDLPRWLLWTPA